MVPQKYEIAFDCEAGAVLAAMFDDCDVSVTSGTTTLRTDPLDPAALVGLLQRAAALRLAVVHVRRLGSTTEP